VYEWKHVASPWCVYEGKDVADECLNGNKYEASPWCVYEGKDVADGCMNGSMLLMGV
jgi:hypothetical protein